MSNIAKFHAAVIECLPILSVDIRQGWIENLEALKKALHSALCPEKQEVSQPEFEIVVDYNLTLKEMIDIGHYDMVSRDINPNRFSIQGRGKKTMTVRLAHFSCAVSSDDVEEKLRKTGYRTATIEELLAFGAAYPEIQRGFPVIALGSVLHSAWEHVVRLDNNGPGRNLDLSFRSQLGRWNEACRFLIVPK